MKHKIEPWDTSHEADAEKEAHSVLGVIGKPVKELSLNATLEQCVTNYVEGSREIKKRTKVIGYPVLSQKNNQFSAWVCGGQQT